MKQVDHAEWELLKLQAAAHLRSELWQKGAFCISPDPAPTVHMPHIAPDLLLKGRSA